jgi:quinohemoprotein ethanol dehydrogenase
VAAAQAGAVLVLAAAVEGGAVLGLGLLAAAQAAAAEPGAPSGPAALGAAAVDDARLRAAAADPANWITYGRDQAEQRYSPLAQIHDGNVGRLVRSWSFDTGLTRGHEATPLVVDGTMYVTGPWSVVFALDARTGRLLWKHDPQVPRGVGAKACCDVVNRGVAAYRGRVYVGTLDGRLVALDARTGERAFEVQTVDPSQPYTVTGAPRVVKGRVILGNGGAEFGVRGYVSAYDPEDGRLVWRTFTVPGDPEKPFESKALERAAATWTGEWWKVGGGGTVWDSMAYDAELDLLYVGTGNGSPWSRYLRSPGGGANLYLASILALDPDDGALRWHYQTTPGDNWDYTATQHILLVDLVIESRPRKVLLQAPKNGFFYVIDRATGEFLSAKPYVEVTWAQGIDGQGRPIPSPSAEYARGTALVRPTIFGGHNWQPMSFHPKTGLVYLPAQEIVGAYGLDPRFAIRAGPYFNTGTDPAHFALLSRETVSGHLLAWDPVRQREVWRHPYALPWNGGTLATAGNLVFQGTADGRFLALRADDGRLLWEYHAGNGIVAAPISYSVGGVQYVAVLAGWGGAFALVGGEAASGARPGVPATGRLHAFALSEQPITVAAVEEALASREPSRAAGEDLYHRWCARCHGAGAVGAGVVADLRRSAPEVQAAFVEIVRGGLPNRGMPPFRDVLAAEEIRQIQAYVKLRAAE